MTNILNEEIRAIKYTIEHLKKGMVLEPDPDRKCQMKNDIKELNLLLVEKLEKCGDVNG